MMLGVVALHKRQQRIHVVRLCNAVNKTSRLSGGGLEYALRCIARSMLVTKR
jgi:hypothetical protein